MKVTVKHVSKTTKRLADGSTRLYYYNRKTGKRIQGEPGSTQFAVSYEESWNTETPNPEAFADLVDKYLNSIEFAGLSGRSRADYRAHLAHIKTKWGDTPVEIFNDGRIRGHVKKWRDMIARSSPRLADYRLAVMKRVTKVSYDNGDLSYNHIAGIGNVYKSDRSRIIWEPHEIEALCAGARPEFVFAIQLARLTGLRRGDLVSIDMNADKGDHLAWHTSKSNKRTEVVIPIIPECRRLLDQIYAHRHDKGFRCTTILSSRNGSPWTPDGFSSTFQRRKDKMGIDKHLHDMRGTFVLELINANFEDRDIAEIVGWKTEDVRSIRRKYVDRGAIVQAAIRRMERNVK